VNALDLWRARLLAGVGGQQLYRPSTWTYDDLWLAAGYEASARDAERDGFPHAAASSRARAVAVLADAERMEAA
jgi:hypothetical protein